MPQTTSAKKALRVSQRRREINDRWRSKLRLTERKLRKAIRTKDATAARTLYVSFQSTIDRMARRHILRKNAAARKKARLAARLTTTGK